MDQGFFFSKKKNNEENRWIIVAGPAGSNETSSAEETSWGRILGGKVFWSACEIRDTQQFSLLGSKSEKNTTLRPGDEWPTKLLAQVAKEKKDLKQSTNPMKRKQRSYQWNHSQRNQERWTIPSCKNRSN